MTDKSDYERGFGDGFAAGFRMGEQVQHGRARVEVQRWRYESASGDVISAEDLAKCFEQNGPIVGWVDPPQIGDFTC